MQNNWTDYNNTFATGAYTKTSGGVILLKGLLKSSGTPALSENIGILPPGYRPASVLIFQTSTNANVASRIDVYPDGTIKFIFGSGGWLSLDGIKFLPAGSPYTFTASALSNGWANYGGGFEPADYAVDGSGRTHVQGLVRSGVVTNGTLIATIPAALLPTEYIHLPADNGGVFGHIGTSSVSAGLLAKGGTTTNGYLSLTNMFYPSSYAGLTNLTLQNAWVWYGTIYSTPQYTKSADGIVSLKGLIKSGTATSGTVLTTLPVGYRPKNRLLEGVVNNAAYGRVDILSDGTVIAGMAVSNVWIALDSINFMAEQ